MNEETTRRTPDDPSGRPAETKRSAGNPSNTTANRENAVASAVDEIGDYAADAAETARDKASEFAERGKTAGAGRMEGFARAARRAADDLQEESPEIAGYVRQAASGLQQAASSVRSRSVGEVMDMVEDFARRQPTAYFGSAVLAGFVLSRFVKSRADRPQRRPRAQTSSEASRWRQDASPAPSAGTPFATRDNLPSTPSSIGETP
jgi:hypothetical protein